ncbi:MAG: TlpA family protein disulfide reductase [Myxococcaceae bacterium]|nr:TlpA family protein disulfide reductase [Myxococcaceae bacterium]
MSRALVMGLLVAGCAHTTEPRFPHRDIFLGTLPQDVVGPVAFDRSAFGGKVVLVTFIATWCFPCLTDLATLDKLERDFGAKGFRQVVVGMDLEGRKVLEPFAAEYRLSYPLLVGDERLRKGQTPFGQIRELPARVLFDRQGEVIAAYSGVVSPTDLEAKVREALDAR